MAARAQSLDAGVDIVDEGHAARDSCACKAQSKHATDFASIAVDRLRAMAMLHAQIRCVRFFLLMRLHDVQGISRCLRTPFFLLKSHLLHTSRTSYQCFIYESTAMTSKLSPICLHKWQQTLNVLCPSLVVCSHVCAVWMDGLRML